MLFCFIANEPKFDVRIQKHSNLPSTFVTILFKRYDRQLLSINFQRNSLAEYSIENL